MKARLELKELKQMIRDKSIDTVLVVFADMQGRLMGKRFQADFFIEKALQETHCCNYLIATDLEMKPVEGYASTGWESGYGDYVMRPDITTLRLIPWLEGTAMVMCDLLDHHNHEPVPHSPRAILNAQLKRLEKLGLSTAFASELEFFVFRESYEELSDNGYSSMTPNSAYNEDYHIFQTTKEEALMRQIRNGLQGAGIRVENTKGEACAGQAEVNVYYTDALEMADNQCVAKNAIKEIAFLNDCSVTFLAKWDKKAAGSSSHIHQSLLDADGTPVFYDPNEPNGMSKRMRHYLAGLLYYAKDTTYFLAPYINSYKRFVAGTFAPTKIVWSVDNRTAGFRVVATNSKSVRVECRIGGSDINPYLAFASQLAAGISGMENELEPGPEFKGDAYSAKDVQEIPHTLTAATRALRDSKMLREAFGNDVVDHYVRAAQWEQEDFERQVTDYEIKRGFERV